MSDEKRVSLVKPPQKKPDDAAVALLGKYGNFDLYEYEDTYYATNVQHELADVRELILENKLISADDEAILRDIIDNNNKWADTRGMYSLDQSDSSAAIRVNSFNLEQDDEESFPDPEIYHSRGEYFIVDSASKSKIENEDLSLVVSYSVAAVPELVTDYKGYNIVEFDKTYFGIRQSIGAVDLTRVSPSRLEGVFYADMVKGVMELIDAEVASVGVYEFPTLLKELNQWNIVGYKKMVYGIAHTLGAFDFSAHTPDELRTHAGIIHGDTLEDVESRVLKKSEIVFSYKVPTLLKEFQAFNIVGYRKKIYGVPHAIGQFDIAAALPEDVERNSDIICGASVAEVEALISEGATREKKGLAEFSVPQQVFLESTAGFNIFLYEDIYFAIPVRFGDYDLGEQDYFSEPEIVYDASLFGLREAIVTNEEIVDTLTKYEQPQLLIELEAFNIVGYQNMIYGIPHASGEFDFLGYTSDGLENHPGLISGHTVEEVESRIEEIGDVVRNCDQSAFSRKLKRFVFLVVKDRPALVKRLKRLIFSRIRK